MTAYDPEKHQDGVFIGTRPAQVRPVEKLIRVMNLIGMIEATEGDTPPADTDKVWLDPEGGTPGNALVKVYNGSTWVAMTPDTFLDHIGGEAFRTALVFKGSWDASAGTFPGAGLAQTGWMYRVTVAGTIGGVLFSPGDDIYAITDNASTSTYASNWLKIEGDQDSFTLRGSAPIATDALTVTSPESTIGGYYSTFECKGLRKLVFVDTETLPQTESGAMRDAMFVQHVCEDVVDLDAAVYRAISSGIRIVMSSKHNGSSYQRVYHDLHGITSHAIGNVGDDQSERGVSGIIANGYNTGGGVVTNEFGAENPSFGVQATTIQAVIGIALNGKADSDSTHTAYGVRASMRGYKGTAAFTADNGVAYSGQNGGAQYGIKMDELTVTTAALFMPASSTGNVGTRIIYDTTDYSDYDRAGNAFGWYIGGTSVLSLGSTGPIAKKFTATDTSDTATEEVLKLEGDRATPTAFDQIQAGWYLSSSTGVQTKVAVIAAQATSVTNGAMSARLGFQTIFGGTLDVRAYLGSTSFAPATNDGLSLGTSSFSFADLFLASGAVINIANDAIITHSTGVFTVSTGDLRVSTAGTNAASVLTVGGAQTPQFTAVELGHASDTTVSRVAAGRLAVESVALMRGAASSTDNAISRYDGTTGDLVQSSSATLDDSGNVTANSFVAYNATDSATIEILKLEGDRATPTAFDQLQIAYYASSSTGVQTKIGVQSAQATSVTNGSMSSRLGFSTISSGTLAVRAYFEAGGIYPASNDGMPLGIASQSFSDLFLASGAVINFNNGDFTMTHAADQLTAAIDGSDRLRIDKTATATHTALMLYDVDNNTLARVTVGAADSGGAGFKVLRIPN